MSSVQTIAPVPEGAETLLLAERTENCILYIAANDRDMQRAAESLSFFAPDLHQIQLPAWDTLPYDRSGPNPAIISERVSAMAELAGGLDSAQQNIILTTANSVLQRIPKPENFAMLQLKKGQSIEPEEVIQFLAAQGYDRVSKVMEAGEFAVRGSIIDLLPSGYADGMRIDFFGDEIERIRQFDVLSQISSGELKELRLLPASEEEIGGEKTDIFSYLPDDSLLIFGQHSLQATTERLELIDDYYNARMEVLEAGQKAPIPPADLYLTDFNAEALGFEKLEFSALGDGETGFRKSPRIGKDFEQLKNSSKPIWVCAFSKGSAEHIKTLLENDGLPSKIVEDNIALAKTKPRELAIFHLPIESGFEGENFRLITEQDIFGDRFIRTIKKRKKSENFLSEANSFELGEIITHEEFGVGKFAGLETLEVQGVRHDMVKLLYADDDRLFVPVENVDLISRFGSADGEVKLDKLGGTGWQEKKAKLRERLKLAAFELLQIAAERELRKTEPSKSDPDLYAEFCDRFPYSETDDQLGAIEDVIGDLEKGRPMDRLVCGDVGFGKTEVALRAAFIASQNGQVAIICPTTLLARQHYATFKKRFDGMPFEIRQLSRMVKPAEIRETKAGLKEGKIDIVIGTHALLAEDVQFKNLQLVIVDEEQRFGVRQKEKLKKFKAAVHMLSLSATPIPRSLQLSISGIRDLSIIATPPVDRLAIRGFVTPFDEVTIKEAILRERNRGGQVFYVAPRISDLADIYKTLEKIVPDVRIAQAHGQMKPQELDEVMNEFYDGKFDVLLSTTIVENGLDVENANTIIIHRADMFGLAQAYQLRGRVGRGKTRGYAYFTLPKNRNLTKNAYKRLEVLQGLDTLGAGFSLASHDMDIRGFGNLLGEEQSGQIKEVGVELYQKMLSEAVLKARAEAKGGKFAIEEDKQINPVINLGVSVLIPEDYVQDVDLRMGLYKRAAGLKSDEEIAAFKIELTDRFGTPPEEVLYLFETIRLKNLCRAIGAEKIDVGAKAVVLQFAEKPKIAAERIMEFAMQNQERVKIKPDKLLFPFDNAPDPADLIAQLEVDLGQLLKSVE